MEKVMTVRNPLGLHARPAALFVQTAGKFKSTIKVIKGEITINGKSVMGLMMLAAECGTQLRIIADGEDEIQALEELEKLFLRNFDE